MRAIVLRVTARTDGNLAGVPALTRQIIGACALPGTAVHVVGSIDRAALDDVLQRAGCDPARIGVHATLDALGALPVRGWLALGDAALLPNPDVLHADQHDAPTLWHCNGERLAAQADRLEVAVDLLDGKAAPATTMAVDAAEVIVLSNWRAAERRIIAGTVKASDGLVARRINRPLSNALSLPAARLGLSPMTFTLATAAVALLMFGALVSGLPHALLAGCLLYQTASVLDGIDGEIARATFKSTRMGANLDTAIDMATNIAFVTGLTIGLARTRFDYYLTFGICLAAAMLFCVLAMILLLYLGPRGGSFDVLGRALAENMAGRPTLQRVAIFVERFFKRDFFALFFALLALAGKVTWIPWFLAFGVTGWLSAILFCAPLILSDKSGRLLPPHLRERRNVRQSEA